MTRQATRASPGVTHAVNPPPWLRGPGLRARPAAPSRRGPCGTPMLLALLLWVCSLVLVGFLVAPFFGIRVAGIVALALLVFFVVACRAICSPTGGATGPPGRDALSR